MHGSWKVREINEKKITSKNILAQVDPPRSLANATSGDMKDPIKHIWMTIVKSNPGQKKELEISGYIMITFNEPTARKCMHTVLQHAILPGLH